MSGDKLVVSYAAIQAAHSEVVGARTTVENVIGGLKAVGGEEQHAKKLDAAMTEYAHRLHAVGVELTGKLDALATFLASAERYYRYVDETALTRAVPYDPAHPSPTMVVSPYRTGVRKLPPGVPDVGAEQGPFVDPPPRQVSGTTVLGVPSGPGGHGTAVHGQAAVPGATPPGSPVFATAGPAGDGVDLGSYDTTGDGPLVGGLGGKVGP